MKTISENSPLIGLDMPKSKSKHPTLDNHDRSNSAERKNNAIWTLVIASTSVLVLVALQIRSSHMPAINHNIPDLNYGATPFAEEILNKVNSHKHVHQKPRYTKVQTLSFQIYTGGAPAYTDDGQPNEECINLNDYGVSEDDNPKLQCYLGLDDTALDVERRLNIMSNAVDRAYDVSDPNDDTLKIFLAPEFYFRGQNGAYEFTFTNEEEEDDRDGCSDICHILKGLESMVAQKRFDNWLFLFGTVIGSESEYIHEHRFDFFKVSTLDLKSLSLIYIYQFLELPVEDTFDYQFYNFAPMYKGFDPDTSKNVGKNFLVPKRYVSNLDFLTPIRHLTNRSIAMELLDERDITLAGTLPNPYLAGHKQYDDAMWIKYKDELTSLGYTMIEYGWFFLDGVAFSIEICVDHMVQRALMTYMADVVTGSKTRIPSFTDDLVEWVGIPKRQAQISLVSSAGMDIIVASLALANGGHIFLQDGVSGDVEPTTTFGTDECSPNTYEFFGGSQCVSRTAVISATDVTFEYDHIMNFTEYEVFPNGNWKEAIEGIFSKEFYEPRLTVYDPVDIALV